MWCVYVCVYVCVCVYVYRYTSFAGGSSPRLTVRSLEDQLPLIFESFNDTFRSVAGRITANKLKVKLMEY